MDRDDLEHEKGIIFLAKTTAINYHDYHINILYTPGLADFCGELGHIMNIVDGCLI